MTLATITNTVIAASGGSSLVSVNVGLMVWTLLVFGISMLILAKFAFPMIQEALDKRQRAIEDSIDFAEQTRKEAEQLLAEYRQRLIEAREQAEQIVARARKTADVHEQELIAEGRHKREEMMEATRREIEIETRRAIGDIRKEVADLTVLATEKVTRKVLSDADHRRLVSDTVERLDFAALSGGERVS